ncbi:MAG: endopeptidase La [Deltaproteobacteria bacterium]|nr:MAG: endopeptidase La [Deltaproteobacteria bacterium]
MAESDKDDLINVIEDENTKVEIPTELALMPVRDIVVFTDMLLPLFVGREKSVQAMEHAVEHDQFVFLATQMNPDIENPRVDDINTVGTVGKILRMLKLPDGRLKALVQGVAKGRIVDYLERKKFYRVRIEVIEDQVLNVMDMEVEALMRNVREHSEKILALRGEFNADVSAVLESIDDPGKLADLVASNLKLKVEEAQVLLETTDIVERLKIVNDFLSREVELSTIQARIQSNVRNEITKNQKDYFLREQVRAIHRELGETDEKMAEIEEYQARIKKARMPGVANEEALRQLKRLEQMHADSSEAGIVRTYLDWLVELPWSRMSRDMLDIARAKKVLDTEHYGLEKVKDRILEYLSVRKLNPDMKGPILCFVGPPGVGKTSLGRSIAKAMKRKFIRISLGGIRDEAEIRGHRRTYIGALPGRIIQGVKNAGTRNPVFMMDEIDKIGADFRGDPSSALLEALDPEQNNAFSDHYLNLPFDLSRVMFILTANATDTIPSALLDRMEVIQLSGYTQEEKAAIADQYLIPRQIKENGLTKRHIAFNAEAVDRMIDAYTSESGLRNLEREIGKVCRKVARKRAEGSKKKETLTEANLHTFLGPPQYLPELDKEESQVGLSTGLAWTYTGGEVLYVEASLIPGKGEMIITGQIGEVMQESARASQTYIRANAKRFGVDEKLFENSDIHIHVPAGAIPKDGPSAGIAITTALLSTLTQKPVRNDVAMTGEITLRGRVLPIGGLKEKALGALRGGIETVIIPVKNEKDLVEIPENVKDRLTFVAVRTIEEALELTIDGVFDVPPAASEKNGAADDPEAGEKA